MATAAYLQWHRDAKVPARVKRITAQWVSGRPSPRSTRKLRLCGILDRLHYIAGMDCITLQAAGLFHYVADHSLLICWNLQVCTIHKHVCTCSCQCLPIMLWCFSCRHGQYIDVFVYIYHLCLQLMPWVSSLCSGPCRCSDAWAWGTLSS